MKKLFFITLLVSALFSSCRKQYSCYCINEDKDVVNQMLKGRITEANAQSQCNTMQMLFSEDDDYQCTAKEI